MSGQDLQAAPHPRPSNSSNSSDLPAPSVHKNLRGSLSSSSLRPPLGLGDPEGPRATKRAVRRRAARAPRSASGAALGAPPASVVPLPAFVSQLVESAAQPLLLAYLPREATEQTLRDALRRFGAVARLHIVRDGRGVSRCFAFAEFERAASGRALLDACGAGEVVMRGRGGKRWYIKANEAELGPRVSCA